MRHINQTILSFASDGEFRRTCCLTAAVCVCNLYIPAWAGQGKQPSECDQSLGSSVCKHGEGLQSHLALFFKASSTGWALCYNMKCGPCVHDDLGVPTIGAELFHPYCFAYSVITHLRPNTWHPTSVQKYCKKPFSHYRVTFYRKLHILYVFLQHIYVSDLEFHLGQEDCRQLNHKLPQPIKCDERHIWSTYSIVAHTAYSSKGR